MLLPNNQRQHRTSHAPKDVLPFRICADNCAPCQPLLRATARHQAPRVIIQGDLTYKKPPPRRTVR